MNGAGMINLDGLFNGKTRTQPPADDAGTAAEAVPPAEDRVTKGLRRLTGQVDPGAAPGPDGATRAEGAASDEATSDEDGRAALARAAAAPAAGGPAAGPAPAPATGAAPDPRGAPSPTPRNAAPTPPVSPVTGEISDGRPPKSSPPVSSPPTPRPPVAADMPASHGSPARNEDEVDLSAMAAALQARAPVSGGRVRTRLLGFAGAAPVVSDPIAATGPARPAAGSASTAPAQPTFPTGWIVVIDGPGRGAAFAVAAGVAQIGRGDDQAIRLDFGDASISRSNHAAIAYDEETRQFFIGHGGKANLVRRNDRPVLATEPLEDRDRIRIGETTLLFVALCGAGFDWRGEDRDA